MVLLMRSAIALSFGLSLSVMLEAWGDMPAHDALAVGIRDDCQEAEAIAQAGCGVFHGNIGDVADPYLVGTSRYHALHKVGICRKVMAGVCRTGGRAVGDGCSAHARAGCHGTRHVQHGTRR